MSWGVTLILSSFGSLASLSIWASSVLPVPGLSVIACRMRIDFAEGFGHELFSFSGIVAPDLQNGEMRSAKKSLRLVGRVMVMQFWGEILAGGLRRGAADGKFLAYLARTVGRCRRHRG